MSNGGQWEVKMLKWVSAEQVSVGNSDHGAASHLQIYMDYLFPTRRYALTELDQFLSLTRPIPLTHKKMETGLTPTSSEWEKLV